MGHGVVLAKQLSHGDGLGVDGAVDHPLLLVVTPLVQQAQGVRQHVEHPGLPRQRLAHQHEADTDNQWC